MGKFELIEVGGEYRWRLRNAYGELVSEGYIWKQAALDAIEAARSAVALADVEDLTVD